MRIAKKMSENFEVFLPDLRNHGNSPHAKEFSINCMTEDIKKFTEIHNLKDVFLLGHSLGGKVALNFASKYPKVVKKLVVVDISPKNYNEKKFYEHNKHQKIISYLKKIDLSKYKSRIKALEDLSKIDKDKRLELFMMKNIKRNKQGNLEWKININSIADNLANLINQFNADLSKITCNTLFIKAENSNYITDDDFKKIREEIAKVQFVTIKDASHWLHSEKPDEFTAVLKKFLI